MRLELACPLAVVLSLSAPLTADVASDVIGCLSPSVATALSEAFTAEAAIIRKGSIKKGTNGGYKTNYLIVPDGPGDGVETVEVTFLPELGAPAPGAPSYTLTSANPNGVGMFRTDEVTFAGDPEGFGYTMVATMHDADGEQIGDAFATGAFAQDVVPLQVASIALVRQDDGEGALSVLLVGDSLEVVAGVEVTLYQGDENPAECGGDTTCPLAATSGETAVAWGTVLTFDDPDQAVGVTYDIELLVTGDDGSVLVSSDFAVTAEAP